MQFTQNSNYCIGAKTKDGVVGFVTNVTEEHKFKVKEKKERSSWTKEQAMMLIAIFKQKNPEDKFTLFKFS